MTNKPQKVLPEQIKNSKKVYQGVRFDVHTLKLPGKSGKTVQRDVVIHPGAVVILPVLDKNRVVMIRNERFAVSENLWELPAGTLEPKEPPEVTAKRELIEETGYECSSLDLLTTFYTTPGFCNERMYAYAAYDLKLVGQNLDESEKITVEAVEWDQILKMIADNTIHDGKTLATLLFYHAFMKHKPLFPF